MSDKDKLSFNEGEEEEFHITDEDIDRELAEMETDHMASASGDIPAEEIGAKPAAKKRFSALKQLKRKHWIIIIIIGIMLIFGLLKLLGSGQSANSFDQIAPVITTKPEMVTKKTFESNPLPDLTVAPTLTPAPTATPSAPSAAKTTTAENENEAKLTEALTAIEEQNKALTTQLTALNNRVVGLESVLNESSHTMQGLVQQTAQQAGTLKKQTTPASPLPMQAQTLPPVPQYTTEAVVPQRAWLQTGDGNTITVTIGDDLPGLGAVVAIDPYSGNVTTASGTVIKYGN